MNINLNIINVKFLVIKFLFIKNCLTFVLYFIN